MDGTSVSTTTIVAPENSPHIASNALFDRPPVEVRSKGAADFSGQSSMAMRAAACNDGAVEQTSFASAEYACKKRQTRRERFFAQMNAVVPWSLANRSVRPAARVRGADRSG